MTGWRITSILNRPITQPKNSLREPELLALDVDHAVEVTQAVVMRVGDEHLEWV